MSWNDYFVTAERLEAALGSPRPPVLLDVRHTPKTEAQPEVFAEGHIPGAQFVDLPAQLAGTPDALSGRYPLPRLGDLQASARVWGISGDSTVVVYDDRQGVSAARAAWLLRWAGLERVLVLDGGYSRWRAEGRAVSTETITPTSGDVVLRGGNLPTLDADGAARFAAEEQLIDARDTTQFLGGPVVAGKAVTGHIPGAVSAPTTLALDENGLLRPEQDVREGYAAQGVDLAAPLAVYCGGGVTAAHSALVLAALGVEAPLFVGSWSAWSADPARPVAIGHELARS